MKTSISIGRDNSNDIVINEPRVSRHHAVITILDKDRFEVKDLGSTNGTFVNGTKVSQQIITEGDRLEVANFVVNWMEEIRKNPVKTKNIKEAPFSKVEKLISIGSGSKNDIILSDNYVSEQHATIALLKNKNYFIQDLNSSNGTFVNGERVDSKNFTRTDIVRIANSPLPPDWFRHPRLKTDFIKDNKKSLIISIALLILAVGSALMYTNRCKWLGIGCNETEPEITAKYKNSIVYIEHEYFYTIQANGKKYFVGKNKITHFTEANPDRQGLDPYNKITGNGSFVNAKGSILTSSLVSAPWVNEEEKRKMLKEIVESGSIEHFSLHKKPMVAGETATLKWIINGAVNDQQNYIDATVTSPMIIKSVKGELPKSARALDYYYEKGKKDSIHYTPLNYISNMAMPSAGNGVIKDSFYTYSDTVNVKTKFSKISKSIPAFSEGSIIINERGELIGILDAHEIIFVSHFIKQLED